LPVQILALRHEGMWRNGGEKVQIFEERKGLVSLRRRITSPRFTLYSIITIPTEMWQ